MSTRFLLLSSPTWESLCEILLQFLSLTTTTSHNNPRTLMDANHRIYPRVHDGLSLCLVRPSEHGLLSFVSRD